MGKILYLLILKPLSWLPLEILYYLSNFIFFLIYHVVGYREKVVKTNLQNSFPEKNEAEIASLSNKFFRHLADLIVESIKLFSISKDEIIRRYKFAKEYNYPVVFVRVNKVKRGFYELDFETIAEDPSTFEHGKITELHAESLEKVIREKPEYWLWTHKR